MERMTRLVGKIKNIDGHQKVGLKKRYVRKKYFGYWNQGELVQRVARTTWEAEQASEREIKMVNGLRFVGNCEKVREAGELRLALQSNRLQ